MFLPFQHLGNRCFDVVSLGKTHGLSLPQFSSAELATVVHAPKWSTCINRFSDEG